MKVKCPTCLKDVEWVSSNQYRPFCSHRCRLIDLGEWASENRTIASPFTAEDIDELEVDFEEMANQADQLH